MIEFAIDLVRVFFKAVKIIILFSIAIMLSACGKSAEEIHYEQARKENAEIAQKFLDQAKNGTHRQSTWEPPKFDAPQPSGDKR